MKILRLFTFLLLQLAYTMEATSQTPFYDALKLRELATAPGATWPDSPPTKAQVTDILSKYCSRDQIDAVFLTANPFIRDFASGWASRSGAGFVGGQGISQLLGKAGNLDVTNLADGFAKFLVERTKEELSVTFFDRFRKLIHQPGYEDFQTLFPQTYATLDVIGDNIYYYEAYINTLRESFEKDLVGLLGALPNVINDGRHSAFFTAHPELKSSCLSALFIADRLLKKQHAGQIIKEFDVTMLDGFNANTNIKSSVQTLQVISESIKSKQPDEYWIDGDSLKILARDPVVLKLYLGLVYQNLNGISFTVNGGTQTAQALLATVLQPGHSMSDILTFVQGFHRETSILISSIRNLESKDRDRVTFTDYYDFYNSSLNVISYASKVNQFPGLSGLVISPEFNQYINLAKTAGNIALDINRKNYSSAIINTYQVYDFAFRATSPAADTTRFKQLLLKYGPFMAAVSQAQNSDDVQKAIQAVALPSGSSRVKRESPFNVSLNAYMGLYYGGEEIKDLDESPANVYGVTAPIGISISRGHSIFFLGTGKKNWGWSSSVFISLIDIGALASFRFQSSTQTDIVGADTTTTTIHQIPAIELEDIISPGIFYSLGIPKTPISINMGVQVGPNLRKVTLQSTDDKIVNDYQDRMYVRYSVSVVVDIPLLNFYTKSKK